MKRAIIAISLAAATAACSTYGDADMADAAPAAGTATAELRDRAGVVKASGSATQVGTGIRVSLTAMNMPQGTYAAHVHTTGRCDAPDFTTAGPHWNPTGAQHGKDNPQGMHKGDLPNLLVGTDGRGSIEYTIQNSDLASMLDADGASLVIHASADDYRTDPSGNSGGRIACGVFG